MSGKPHQAPGKRVTRTLARPELYRPHDHLWVIHMGDYFGCKPRMLYADCDIITCQHDLDELECTSECIEVHAACCYLSVSSMLHGGGYELIPHDQLLGCPSSWEPPRPSPMPLPGHGYVYLMALVPDLDIGRIKVGWTDNIDRRLKQYRTGNPIRKTRGWSASASATHLGSTRRETH